MYGIDMALDNSRLSKVIKKDKDRSEIKYTKLNADILSNISDEKCINKKLYF